MEGRLGERTGRPWGRAGAPWLGGAVAEDLGGQVAVGQAQLRIVGIADGGNAVLGTYAFVHRGALVLAGFGDPAYLFVRAAPGADPEDLARRIDALPRVRALASPRRGPDAGTNVSSPFGFL